LPPPPKICSTVCVPFQLLAARRATRVDERHPGVINAGVFFRDDNVKAGHSF